MGNGLTSQLVVQKLSWKYNEIKRGSNSTITILCEECKLPQSHYCAEPSLFCILYPQGNLSDMAFLFDRAVKRLEIGKVASF